MIKLAISGAHGRMGKRITQLATEDKELQITCLLEHENHPKTHETVHGISVYTANSRLKGSDVLIEFTLPEGTIQNLKACVGHGVKMVIGTTGFTDDQISQIKEASKKIPIVFASNMSVGVNLLFKLTEMAALTTHKKYNARITETHHVHKKDSPSGTAKTLAEVAKKAGQAIDNIDSLREGEVIGDHSITFESDEDIITLTHHAKSRDIFANGALIAAKFLKGKDKGLYTMQDVLGLT